MTMEQAGVVEAIGFSRGALEALTGVLWDTMYSNSKLSDRAVTLVEELRDAALDVVEHLRDFERRYTVRCVEEALKKAAMADDGGDME